jgi:uncharacterized protein YciI
MPVFLYRLTPPRPSFPADMTPEEGAAMRSHFGYWAEQMQRGAVLLVGPVPDPKGTYGIAVLTVDDEAQARSLCENDPAIAAKLGFSFDLYPMPDAMVQATTDKD